MRMNPYFDPESWGTIPVEFVIEDGVLVSCKTMASEIVVPDGVTAIGDRAFEGCLRPVSIRLPDSVMSLGEYPFNWCRNLSEFHIPDRLVEGMSLMSAMWLFDETYMNHPNNANHFIRHVLAGTGDFSPGWRKICMDALYNPFFRSTWITNSILEDQPQWLERILEMNPNLPASELEYGIRLSVEHHKPAMTAMLLNFKHNQPRQDAFLGALDDLNPGADS